MKPISQTPVLVGVAQLLQRCEDPLEAAEPLEMMIAALERAGEDCGAPKLLQRADSIRVLAGAWGYGDPAHEIARRLGAAPRETVGTRYGGDIAQRCVADAACEIQTGRSQVVLVASSVNGRSQQRAQRRGIELRTTDLPGAPDRVFGEDQLMFHPAELARGLNRPIDMFAIIESAIRFARGEPLETHVKRVSELWAAFSEVARSNPGAWLPKPYSAQEIRRAARDNPMISYPYTRLMSANAPVDMAAGVILSSFETARAAGVPVDKLVFLHAATAAHESTFLSNRQHLHRSPAIRIAGERALELAGKTIGGIDHLDLYSCFPAAVEVAQSELDIFEGHTPTVTGGHTFGGGPLNAYGLHAIARMTEVLREDPGSMGFVSGIGGWLARHAFGVYSSEPPTHGFRCDRPQHRVDALPCREAVIDWEGAVTIEAYTVAYHVGEPRIGYAACLTDDGRRTWATQDEPSVLEAMTREEFCGRRGHLAHDGRLDVE